MNDKPEEQEQVNEAIRLLRAENKELKEINERAAVKIHNLSEALAEAYHMRDDLKDELRRTQVPSAEQAIEMKSERIANLKSYIKIAEETIDAQADTIQDLLSKIKAREEQIKFYKDALFEDSDKDRDVEKSDVTIIRGAIAETFATSLIGKAISGEAGIDQRRIACEGMSWVELLLRKNKAYRSSAWETPTLAPKLSPSDAILVRMSDKIQRLQTLMSNPEIDNIGESVEDTMRDLGAYCILYLARPKNACGPNGIGGGCEHGPGREDDQNRESACP